MNTFTKTVLLAGLCLFANTLRAQIIITDTQPTKPSSAPLKRWFTLTDETVRYEAIIELDKGESMVVRFQKLSDWTGGADFIKALNAAGKVMNAYKDSLSGLNTQVLDIHIPPNEKNIVTRLQNVNESGNLSTISDDGIAALKVGVDTLRILQARKDTSSRIQYTLQLKELANFHRYANDETWKNYTITALDSIVAEYTKMWKRPDAKRHGLNIVIKPFKTSHQVTTVSRLLQDRLIIDGGLGMSLVRNSICPNAEAGIGLYFGKDEYSSGFVRFSGYAFTRFKEISPDRYKGYGTTFINLEVGVESFRSDRKSFFSKTSLGFGYKLINKKGEDRDPSMANQMYRLFFNYSINKNLTLTPEFFVPFKKSQREGGWVGFSFRLNLF